MIRYRLVLLLGVVLCGAGCSLIGGNDDEAGSAATFTASSFAFQIEGDPVVELGDVTQFFGEAERTTRLNGESTLVLTFTAFGAIGQVPQRRQISADVLIIIPLGPDGTIGSCAPCSLGGTTDLNAGVFYRSSFSTDTMEVSDRYDFRGLVLELEDFEISESALSGTYRLEAEQTEGVRRRLVFLEDGLTEEVLEPIQLTTDGTIRVEGSFALKSSEIVVRYDKATP